MPSDADPLRRETERLRADAAEVLAVLRARGATLAVAESLTGGLLAAALTAVPGASAVFRGGVAAYAGDTKTSLLGVPEHLVRDPGVVSEPVAAAMAAGARDRLAATYALSTTGVAGPDPQEGRPVGTVFVAVCGPAGTDVRALGLDGDRDTIRTAACRDALDLLRRTLGTAEATGEM